MSDTLLDELSAIKDVEDTVVGNKVANFAYDDYAYEHNDANGVDTYNVNNHQNIPNGTASIMKVNSTILTKGWRAQASAITRMAMNHFLGRISYNLNKINDLFSLLLTKFMAFLGSPNGIATLDANGRIPYSQLPESAVELKGYWDADTNTPTLADGTGTNGDEYLVSVAGTQDLGSGSQYFGVGDRVVYTGGVWKNISSGFIRTVNAVAPDAQGDVKAVLGSDTFPVTRSLLSAVFGRVLVKNWKSNSSVPSTVEFHCLCYANGLWVAGCNDTAHPVYWSTDGKNWTAGTGIPTYSIITVHRLRYANSIWVFATSKGVFWSTDGKNWTAGTGLTGDNCLDVFYGDGIWVLANSSGSGYGGGLYWSTDGKNWTVGTGVTNAGRNDGEYNVYYADGVWVGLSNETYQKPYWSTDGKNWTAGTGIASQKNYLTVYHANGLWIATADVPYWSTDGKNWTAGTVADGSTFISVSVYYANGMWLVGGGNTNAGIYWSVDGKIWAKANVNLVNNTGASNHMNKFYFVNGIWIACSSYFPLWSEDGINWFRVYLPNNYVAQYDRYASYDVLCIDNLWVMVGLGIFYSSIEDLIADGAIDLGADVPIVNE